MHEESLKSYSQKDLNNLQERGVHIPDLKLVHITRDVQLENIAPGSTLYPFVRITGSKTQILSGARIGVRGPVILENCFIGESSVIGDLGQVTLIDSVVGAKSVLGAGVAEQAVFLYALRHAKNCKFAQLYVCFRQNVWCGNYQIRSRIRKNVQDVPLVSS